MARLAAILALALGVGLAAAPEALAHRLNVFAKVEGAEVAVETKFSNGRHPKVGTVVVYDGAEAEIARFPLSEDGTARFPLPEAGRESGLRIEVETGEAHSNYWILTPDDIAAGGE